MTADIGTYLGMPYAGSALTKSNPALHLTNRQNLPKLQKGKYDPMSLLKAYLQQSKVQKVLNSKPQDEGFSLIELVVVVAVLAILAAIAIPQFSQLSDDARLNSAKSIIANMYKECEFNKARKGTGSHSDSATQPLNGVAWGGELAGGTTTCSNYGWAAVDGGPATSGVCYVSMDLRDGTQKYGVAPTQEYAKATWPSNMEDCT